MALSMRGDDEIDALLAEMGGAEPSTTSSLTSKTAPSEPPKKRNFDLRLTENPQELPPRFSENFRFRGLLSGESCTGWKRDSNKDTCRICASSASCHWLRTTKSASSDLLPLLFTHVRNIRCIASENISPEQQPKAIDLFSKIKNLLNTKEASRKLSPTDLTSLREKANDLGSILENKLLSDASKTDRLEWRLKIMAKADLVYYRIYYASLTMMSRNKSHPIPHPPTYFSCPGLSWNVSAGKHCIDEFSATLDDETRCLLIDTFGLLADTESSESLSNPLHVLWKHRFLEQLRHFWKTGYASLTTKVALDSAKVRPGNMQPEFEQHETLANSILAEWRDVARDFPASMYAYATPSPECIECIEKHVGNSTVIEMGAGTGYWASLLQLHGCLITPYDLAPPGADSTYNEYHGEVPAFTSVQGMDSTRFPSHKSSEKQVLFLCYPPPGTDMAVSALRAFGDVTGQNKMVLHVGEWSGLTGDAVFENALKADYRCQAFVPLPTWGTDAAYLTVWENTGSRTVSCNVANGGCSMTGCSKQARRRCRFARSLCYCGASCFEAHRKKRRSLLTIQMLDLRAVDDDYDLAFDNPRHFTDMTMIMEAGMDEKKRPHLGSKRRRKIRRDVIREN